MVITWEANDSWFDDYKLARTRALLIHQDMDADAPHLAPIAWWIVTGRVKYRVLATDVRNCDECETLCHVADLFENSMIQTKEGETSWTQ